MSYLSRFRGLVTHKYPCCVQKMSTNSMRVGLVQLTSTSDKSRNREKCSELIKKAKGNGASVVFLPEGFDFIGESSKQTAELAEPLIATDGTIAFYRQLALELNVALSLGGFHERVSNSDRLANSHVFIGADGKVKDVYRKAHLFDVEIPEQKIKLRESDYVQPGDKICTPLDLQGFKLGLAICYDLRFPEMSLALMRKGANILAYPSAFTVPTGVAHWFPLLRARAIETQSYVIAAAQTGSHNAKRSSFGHACIIDPWGTIIAQCPEGEDVVVAELCLEKLNQVRRKMPINDHRRLDLYGLCVSGGIQVGDADLDQTQFYFGPHLNSGRCIVLQSRKSYVLVNKKPRPGHLLAIPKRPDAKRLCDLTPDEVQDLFMIVQEAQKLVESFFQATSSTVSIQDGPEAGQTVNHVHVHILPRIKDDFENNDDVYNYLANHDRGDDILWRTEDEMASECLKLRQHFVNKT